jgi:hypothetical protein
MSPGRRRTSSALQAKSRHTHLASLGTYVRLGEHTTARVTADTGPAARRRTRWVAESGSPTATGGPCPRCSGPM